MTPPSQAERERVEADREINPHVGQPLRRRLRNFTPEADTYVASLGGPLPYMQRLTAIEAETDAHRERLAEAYATFRGDPSGWRRVAESWSFFEVNELIEKHNLWYPDRGPPADGPTLARLRQGRRPAVQPAAARHRLDPRTVPLRRLAAMSEHDHDHDHDHEGHDHAHHDHDHEGHDHEHDEDAILEAEREQLRRQALAQIRQYPDVALRMPAREVTEFDDYLVQLVERMQHLMHDAQGVGLAATQVGVLQRVFLIDTGGDEGLQALINPTIVVSRRQGDRRRRLPLPLGRARASRAIPEGDDRREGSERRGRAPRARRPERPGCAARARPPSTAS